MELNYNSLSSISSLLQNPFEDPSLQTSLNRTTYYRSFDSIENLKIKAHLVKIADINHRNIFRNIRDVSNKSADGKGFKEVTIDDDNKENENDDNNNKGSSSSSKPKPKQNVTIASATSALPPSFETVIRWQEKIFSPTYISNQLFVVFIYIFFMKNNLFLNYSNNIYKKRYKKVSFNII